VEQVRTESAGVTRGVNAAFVLPPDPTRAEAFLAPALERVDAAAAAAGPQLLIVTADAEAAMAVAAVADAIGRPRGLRVVAATSEARAARILRRSPPQVVVGAPDALLGLLRRSMLKLGDVRHLVLAWVDDALATHQAALDALLAEAPKEAARTIVAGRLSPEVEQLIERHARRARRVLPPAGEPLALRQVQFVATPEASKPAALRRVLDELDPESAFIVARDPQSGLNAGTVLRTMGYADDGGVRAGDRMTADADVLVFYDLPATGTEVRFVMNGHDAGRMVALVLPRQLPALRELAGDTVVPLVLPEPAARARGREEQLRDALHTELAAGVPAHELLALEPLLAEYDGVEIAAAAVRLLEAEQRRPGLPAAGAPPARMARLFVNAGQTDGLRAGDLVGAIANVAGLTGQDIGRVELRDRHALVEVPERLAATVAEKLTGVTVKGRQLVARLDQERPDRGAHGPRPDRGTHGGRGSSPRRSRPGGDRTR
jgi:ATP-dependent RNA helicase DeaD